MICVVWKKKQGKEKKNGVKSKIILIGKKMKRNKW